MSERNSLQISWTGNAMSEHARNMPKWRQHLSSKSPQRSHSEELNWWKQHRAKCGKDGKEFVSFEKIPSKSSCWFVHYLVVEECKVVFLPNRWQSSNEEKVACLDDEHWGKKGGLKGKKGDGERSNKEMRSGWKCWWKWMKKRVEMLMEMDGKAGGNGKGMGRIVCSFVSC